MTSAGRMVPPRRDIIQSRLHFFILNLFIEVYPQYAVCAQGFRVSRHRDRQSTLTYGSTSSSLSVFFPLVHQYKLLIQVDNHAKRREEEERKDFLKGFTPLVASEAQRIGSHVPDGNYDLLGNINILPCYFKCLLANFLNARICTVNEQSLFQ